MSKYSGKIRILKTKQNMTKFQAPCGNQRCTEYAPLGTQGLIKEDPSAPAYPGK